MAKASGSGATPSAPTSSPAATPSSTPAPKGKKASKKHTGPKGPTATEMFCELCIIVEKLKALAPARAEAIVLNKGDTMKQMEPKLRVAREALKEEEAQAEEAEDAISDAEGRAKAAENERDQEADAHDQTESGVMFWVILATIIFSGGCLAYLLLG